MTLFDNERNGKYETDHIHMCLNERIDFSEIGLTDDKAYSVFVHEYIHYYQHFATLYGSQYCKMSNMLFIETREYLKKTEIIELPFGIWEHHEGIASYRKRANDIRGSIDCGHIVGDIEIDSREILIADKEKKAVKIGVYDYSENEAYEDGFYFGYYCIIESMAHMIQKIIYPDVEHNQIPYEAVEKICAYWYPEIKDDARQMVTMCMCALMFDNPGVGFFVVVDFAKEHVTLKGVDFFQEFIQTSSVTYKGEKCAMDYIGKEMLNEYKISLQAMCGCPLEYYNKVVDSFIQDFQSGICGLLMWLYSGDINDRKQFMALVDAYGLPYIETPEMTILPKNINAGHPYLETAALAGFELIFRRLQKLDGDECPMYRVCKLGRFTDTTNVDELCGKEQWKKECECLMVHALKYYKLKDKEFVS